MLTKNNDIDNLEGTFSGAGENSLPCYPGTAYLQRLNQGKDQFIPKTILSSILLDARDQNVFLKTKLARPIVIEVSENIIRLEISN